MAPRDQHSYALLPTNRGSSTAPDRANAVPRRQTPSQPTITASKFPRIVLILSAPLIFSSLLLLHPTNRHVARVTFEKVSQWAGKGSSGWRWGWDAKGDLSGEDLMWNEGDTSPYHSNGLYLLPPELDISSPLLDPLANDPGEEALEAFTGNQTEPLADSAEAEVGGLFDVPASSRIGASLGVDNATSVSPHPILTLIEKAEQDWEGLLNRTSKTLGEACREYERRYGMRPPKGFDQWWNYAVENDVILKDEYDQIFRDMKEFRALHPNALTQRSRVMTERESSFTIGIHPGGEVGITGEAGDIRRATDTADLIRRFSQWIPLPGPKSDSRLNLTFTRHDQPACQLGWKRRSEMRQAVEEGRYFDPEAFVPGVDARLTNWANGCPEDSPLRRHEVDDLETSHPSHPSYHDSRRSFIYSHTKAMDICHRPEIMSMHGFTHADGTSPGELIPLFTFAKTTLHSDILATPLEQYSDTYIGYDMDWELKPRDRLLWRGSTTGAEFKEGYDWERSQRTRLHFLTHEKHGNIEVLWSEGNGEVMRRREERKTFNEAVMDTSFAGQPVQCDEVSCQRLKEIIDFAPTMGLDESYEYKYLIDVDGNGWSGRFHRLMSTKSVVLKSTIFPEWYSDRVMPWVHYVPIKVDYSDLYDVMSFFVGTLDGKGSHDEVAAKLARQGKEWARDHWRRVDMAAYMFRLLLEYSRLFRRWDTENPDDLDYVHVQPHVP